MTGQREEYSACVFVHACMRVCVRPAVWLYGRLESWPPSLPHYTPLCPASYSPLHASLPCSTLPHDIADLLFRLVVAGAGTEGSGGVLAGVPLSQWAVHVGISSMDYSKMVARCGVGWVQVWVGAGCMWCGTGCMCPCGTECSRCGVVQGAGVGWYGMHVLWGVAWSAGAGWDSDTVLRGRV